MHSDDVNWGIQCLCIGPCSENTLLGCSGGEFDGCITNDPGTLDVSMTLLTIIGDPHAKPDNLDKINTLFDIVEDLGNTCVWLGDLLDTKEMVRGKALNTYIRRLKASKLKHYVLIGNHDWFNLECKEHSLEPLKELKNVVVVDKPVQHGAWVFFPYTHDPKQFKAWLQDYGDGARLFCHADIKDFDYGNGLVSTEGLDASDFKRVLRVISGHYHKYQEVGNITYLGTPFSHSFGESNQEKYLGLYDIEQDRLELLPTPFPAHQTIEVDAAEHATLETNPSDIYRVVLKGTQEQIDRFQKAEGVRYIEKPTDSGLVDSAITETQSPPEQFVKWAMDVKGYSEEIVKLGLEVLADVQSN